MIQVGVVTGVLGGYYRGQQGQGAQPQYQLSSCSCSSVDLDSSACQAVGSTCNERSTASGGLLRPYVVPASQYYLESI
jgi:hypothetical protein